MSRPSKAVFNDIDMAIEEAIWSRYNIKQKRHYMIVQLAGGLMRVQVDRGDKGSYAMWSTRNF